MSKLVFDIETVGIPPNEEVKPILLKRAQTEDEEQDILNCLGLSPVTARIVTIAMADADTGESTVFYEDPENPGKSFTEKGVSYHACSEKEILGQFWLAAGNAKKIITYNGRNFDCPFIMIRSAVHEIKCTRNLIPYRFNADFHIDLYDQMTFYGAMRRHFSLDLVTRLFGITSPKEEGVSGDQVQAYYEAGKHLEIARYCMRDTFATLELYKKWKKYLSL